ncbi:MAG TPA: hypothetical protein VLC09_10085 [Polyangiaceae bacterium]|nr:hypothetical protein [Polyangiaceae bacterium]
MIRPALAPLLLVLPFAAACGGSASETPPPVEPPVERLHMDEEGEQADAPAQSDPDDAKPQ